MEPELPETPPVDASEDMGWRTDRHVLLRKPRTNGSGGLILDAFVSKPGVLTYKTNDGREIRELVPANVLHSSRSLDSARLSPVTVDHPEGGVVTAQNFQQLAVGMAGERVDIAEDGKIRLVLNVASERGVQAIEGRLDGSERRQEVSAGYFVRVDETPGVHSDFGQFDRTQIERVYNHFALVHAGRAGSTVRVRADEAHRLLDEGDDEMQLQEQLDAAKAEAAEFKSRLDAIDAEKVADLKEVFDGLTARIDDLEAALEATACGPSDEELEAASTESAKARLDDRLLRRRMDGLLSEAKLDIEDADKLDTPELIDAVFSGLSLTDIKLDGVNEADCRKAAVIFHLDRAPTAHPYEIDSPSTTAKSETEQPSARLDALFDIRKPHPDKTAQA